MILIHDSLFLYLPINIHTEKPKSLKENDHLYKGERGESLGSKSLPQRMDIAGHSPIPNSRGKISLVI